MLQAKTKVDKDMQSCNPSITVQVFLQEQPCILQTVKKLENINDTLYRYDTINKALFPIYKICG